MTAQRDAVRAAVRRALQGPGRRPLAGFVVVACSGGADSLALAAATAEVAARLPLDIAAVIVDHGLQPRSAEIAARAAQQCAAIGIRDTRIRAVRVPDGAGGPEAAARAARYEALDREAGPAGRVLLGHTRDDQAETVLLGLARGSGARSLSGMAPARGAYLRPLLGLDRAVVRQACLDWGLQPWDDPHNSDARFTRVRVRTTAMPALVHALGRDAPAALARSADLLRDDADALDRWADDLWAAVRPAPGGTGGLRVADVADLPVAVQRRVLRRFLAAADVPVQRLTADHLRRCAALVTDWHGQGAIALPGGAALGRSAGVLTVGAADAGFRRGRSQTGPQSTSR